MLEFEDLVYLDVQKTGSSFVAAFLRTFAATKEVRSRKHGRVENRDDGKLYVISCRDPLGQYLSLYSYGCKGAGALRDRLVEAGLERLYDKTLDGFSQWLELIVTPEGSLKYLAGGDKDPWLATLEYAGFQTVRFARMAIPKDTPIKRKNRSKAVLQTHLKSASLTDVVLKQESLNEDILALVRKHAGKFKNIDRVETYLSDTHKINRTPETGIDPTKLPRELLAYVQEREWLYFEDLGYQRYI